MYKRLDQWLSWIQQLGVQRTPLVSVYIVRYATMWTVSGELNKMDNVVRWKAVISDFALSNLFSNE